MFVSRRLVATFAYKVQWDKPKVLYLGYDADEAKKALEEATDKGYFEIKVCRDIDWYFLARWHTSSPVLAKT